MLRDMLVALRSFVREPGFAAVLVLTIAVGIGATTAIVSVVHAVMLKPLPYRDPSSLVRVLNRQSFPDMEDWIAQNETVETFGGYNGWASDVLIGDAPERIQGAIVTGSLLPMMGVAPSVGRLITLLDNVQGGGAVVVLSHDFWAQRLAKNPDVIGTTLSMSERPTTVIGIMPKGFRLPLIEAEYWLPHRVVSPDNDGDRKRTIPVSIFEPSTFEKLDLHDAKIVWADPAIEDFRLGAGLHVVTLDSEVVRNASAPEREIGRGCDACHPRQLGEALEHGVEEDGAFSYVAKRRHR